MTLVESAWRGSPRKLRKTRSFGGDPRWVVGLTSRFAKFRPRRPAGRGQLPLHLRNGWQSAWPGSGALAALGTPSIPRRAVGVPDPVSTLLSNRPLDYVPVPFPLGPGAIMLWRSHTEVAMSFIAAALQETAEFPHPESLETFRANLDPAWIEAALEATGTATLRRRRLPAEQVIWLVLGMALLRDRPIAEVVSKLDLALPGKDGSPVVASSSVAQARQRVGSEPLAWLFDRSARRWAHRSAREHSWHGLALYGVDGSTLRVADSEDNREHYGLADGGARGKSGYPLVRIAVLMALRSHVLATAQFGPFAVGEHELCEALWPEIPDESLTIMDRNFQAAYVFWELQHHGAQRHWLVRAKAKTKWKVTQSFGRWDKLVELTASRTARRKDPTLPETLVARAVSYRHPKSKGRQWLLTSLLDTHRYPAADIVAVYHERWEIELGYGEIKTQLLQNEETIRSRTVDGVEQELWGILLAYNLIRLDMERIAAQAEVPPSRISFVAAMRFIRDEWAWCAVASPGSIPKKLQRMRDRVASFVLPPRRHRSYPRAVKVKMSNYAKKRGKRSGKAAK